MRVSSHVGGRRPAAVCSELNARGTSQCAASLLHRMPECYDCLACLQFAAQLGHK